MLATPRLHATLAMLLPLLCLAPLARADLQRGRDGMEIVDRDELKRGLIVVGAGVFLAGVWRARRGKDAR